MSLLSAAAQDEDGDIIRALRAENEQLRQSLLAMHNALEMTAKSGAFYARANEGLRNAVIHWATRAEQAQEMLAAVGAGGVGPLMPPPVVKESLTAERPQQDGPGLTMCRDGLCPNYRTCFRAQAEPGPNQGFYDASPREGDQCRLYAPMLRTDGTSALKEHPCQ